MTTCLATVLMFSLVLLTTGAATGARLMAQDPLQERLEFLKTNLERYLSHSGPEEAPDVGVVKFEAVNFATCKISWKISTDTGHNAALPIQVRDVKVVNHVSVNLSSIDPARTKIHLIEQMKQRNIPWSLALELNVRAGTPGFTQQMVTTRAGQVTRVPALQERQFSFFFNFEDRRVAEDVAKAFADASGICRARTARAR